MKEKAVSFKRRKRIENTQELREKLLKEWVKTEETRTWLKKVRLKEKQAPYLVAQNRAIQ